MRAWRGWRRRGRRARAGGSASRAADLSKSGVTNGGSALYPGWTVVSDDADSLLAVMKAAAGAPEKALPEGVLLPGTRLGRYELGRQLGRGSFGVVVEARDPELQRR